jgi:glycolate oxidase iron-sulfur subunit
MIAATARPEALNGGRGTAEEPRPPQARGVLGGDSRTGMLMGCIQDGLLGRVNQATARVLEANGFRVMKVPGQGCCGAIHAHTGDLEGARELARKNIRAFESMELDLVAVNAAGCGASMKEYPHLLAGDNEYLDRATALASRVQDVSEILGRPGLLRGGVVRLTVTYDAPCHLLHAQQVSEEPVNLLASIPGLELVPLRGNDECCGGAGIYGVTHPDLGGRIVYDKTRAIMETGAQAVATGNPGCMMQIGAALEMEGARMDVLHPIELVDESYRRGGLYT